ncbi:hypothetical protein ACEPAF_1626 [Sanghuangporus sanghuang]
MSTAIEEVIVSGAYYYLSLAVLAFYVTYPISSTVIKYRANYAPRPIQLAEEGNQSQSEATPKGDSFLGMLRRVYQLEGWRGFFKGSFPALIFVQYFLSLVLSATVYHAYSRIFHPRGVLFTLVTGLFEVVIFLPLRILITRAITSPYTISWYNASSWLRLLLTSTERRHPRLLFVDSKLLTCGGLILILNLFFKILLHQFQKPSRLHAGVARSLATFGIYLAVSLPKTLISTSLAVIFTRLCIQRNRSMDGVEGSDEDVPVDAIYSSKEENVVILRDDSDPYTGLVDCVKRIGAEEGYTTLIRAWWFDLIFFWLSI